MIIEPIQAEGGDRHAPAEFFQGLRQLALDEDVVFIVDEVRVCAVYLYFTQSGTGTHVTHACMSALTGEMLTVAVDNCLPRV